MNKEATMYHDNIIILKYSTKHKLIRSHQDTIGIDQIISFTVSLTNINRLRLYEISKLRSLNTCTKNNKQIHKCRRKIAK